RPWCHRSGIEPGCGMPLGFPFSRCREAPSPACNPQLFQRRYTVAWYGTAVIHLLLVECFPEQFSEVLRVSDVLETLQLENLTSSRLNRMPLDDLFLFARGQHRHPCRPSGFPFA